MLICKKGEEVVYLNRKATSYFFRFGISAERERLT